MIKYIAGAFAVLLSLAASAQAPTVNVGQTTVLTGGDNGNGNLLVAQAVTVTAAQAGTVQSESFYVTAAAGNLVLALYDATGSGGKPGHLLAQTASFAPQTGWNTVNLTAPPTIAAGNYWLAYAPSSNNLAFVKQNNSGSCYYYSRTFSATLPATFSTSPNNCTPTTWSLYMTIQPGAPPPPPPPPPAPTVSLNGVTQVALNWSSTNATGCTASGSWSGSEPLSGSAAVPITANDASYTLTCSGLGGTATAMLSPTLSWPTQVGGDFVFTPLHTYFMSPSGSDANSGTDTAHPWLTPNHPVVCGDVILAKPGAYSSTNTASVFGTVSNCPSTTGGIDGNGQIYFATLLCGGTSVGDCSITQSCTGISVQPAMQIQVSNWSVQGWQANTGYTSTCAGNAFVIDTSVNGPVIHHIAYINNIAVNNAAGFTVNSNGAGSTFVGFGVDYWAIVGNIAQNSAGRYDGFFDSAIDIIGPKNWDTVAGTHIFVANNLSFNNQQPLAVPLDGGTDGESYMFDTLDALPFDQQIVMRNNYAVLSERYNLQLFYQVQNALAPTLKIYNNTSYASVRQAFSKESATGAAYGDVNIQSNAANLPWVINFYNNIVLENRATAANGDPIYTVNIGGNYTSTYIGAVVQNPANSQNILKGLASTCRSTCDGGNNINSYGPTVGVNTYTDPLFNNTTDLLANRMGVPNCSGFFNIIACMGWNASTQTATNPSFIYDLIPTAAGTAGKGAQLPSLTCNSSDPDYPAWLKGIVYLHADSGWTNGTTITEKAGLVTKPCGM